MENKGNHYFHVSNEELRTNVNSFSYKSGNVSRILKTPYELCESYELSQSK